MPTIILDRDGVINHDSDAYIKSPSEWVAIPGSLSAMGDLYRAGYDLAIATNQSGLGRGLFDLPALEAIHEKLRKELQAHDAIVSVIAFCPHHPDTQCSCRKPQTGLLTAIHAQLPIDSDSTWFVGDTAKDLECAQRMGIRGALVRTGKGAQTETALVSRETRAVFDDLRAFTDWLLAY